MKRLLTIVMLAALAFVPGCEVPRLLSEVPTDELMDELRDRDDFVPCLLFGDCEE